MLEKIQFDRESIKLYDEMKYAILESVNKKIFEDNRMVDLIGGRKNIQIMLDNHRNHIAFISIIMKTGNLNLLDQTLPWIYHSYRNQGFSLDYFLTALLYWKETIEEIASEKKRPLDSLKALYDRMIDQDERNRSLSADYESMGSNSELTEDQNEFTELLIAGSQRALFTKTDSYFNEGGDLIGFYRDMLTPAMYQIGVLWENGRISVAEEHLASSIATRILATHYSRVELPDLQPNAPKILVCASTNEYHEIGAWMIANLFEEQGWDVNYLGANTPVKDVETLLGKFKPALLGLSVTMAFNLDKALELIQRIRANEETQDIKIMLGGNLFINYPELVDYTGADYIAGGFEDALAYAESLIENGKI
ncbi:MAG: cobalamin-dependent protein [Spirochaetales bacterium]|nr:cobalamin-dependent protein [Spirochaetales bacterium]